MADAVLHPTLTVDGVRVPNWVASVHPRFQTCSGETCGARILWCKTRNGKNAPLELVELEGGKKEWWSHHARCPDAARFRK